MIQPHGAELLPLDVDAAGTVVVGVELVVVEPDVVVAGSVVVVVNWVVLEATVVVAMVVGASVVVAGGKVCAGR